MMVFVSSNSGTVVYLYSLYNTTTNEGCLHLTVACFPLTAELWQKIAHNGTCQIYLQQNRPKNKSSSSKTLGIFALFAIRKVFFICLYIWLEDKRLENKADW